jgi:NAD(P)H-nitrite reductase large subunit
MLEGQIAGLAASRQIGYLDEARFKSALNGFHRLLIPQRRFAEALNEISHPPAGLDAIISDDTIVCRCEDITAGQVRAAIKGGAHQLDELKTATYIGQGPCQGRTCGPILARMVAHQTGRTPVEIGHLNARPPVKPLPLSGLNFEKSDYGTG